MSGKDDDSSLFRRQMAGVKPLRAEERISPPRRAPSPHPRPHASADPDPGGFVERRTADPVAPEETLRHSRAGVQPRLLRRLRRGELRPEARLDLHGHTIAEAGQRLATFLHEARRGGLRCVCLVHGKGHRSETGRPALKAQIAHWLRDAPGVLAYHSAQPRDGGAGALYVLLRRAD